MLDTKPSTIADVPFIPDLDPLLIGGFHVIVYEPVFSRDNLSVIDEDVDDILVGKFAFPGAVLYNEFECNEIHFILKQAKHNICKTNFYAEDFLLILECTWGAKSQNEISFFQLKYRCIEVDFCRYHQCLKPHIHWNMFMKYVFSQK